MHPLRVRHHRRIHGLILLFLALFSRESDVRDLAFCSLELLSMLHYFHKVIGGISSRCQLCRPAWTYLWLIRGKGLLQVRLSLLCNQRFFSEHALRLACLLNLFPIGFLCRWLAEIWLPSCLLSQIIHTSYIWCILTGSSSIHQHGCCFGNTFWKVSILCRRYLTSLIVVVCQV